MHAKSTTLEAGQRRRFSRWAVVHAWKLAGLTAIVTFVGVFIAVTLSLILRPTRSYFFPLLSDVDKYQPEGSILRIALVAATALLFATTTASVLHCHSLRLFHRDRNVQNDLEEDVCSADDTSEITPNTPVIKRRLPRIFSLPLLITLPLSVTVLLTFLQYSGLGNFLYETLHRRLLFKIALYGLSATWMAAMCFLTWYFLKLQNMPDRIPLELPDQHTGDTLAETADDIASSASAPRAVGKLKTFVGWVVVILRPVCLTGQVVCMIKIVGLWLALDTFSISNIRLVKIALLAALAFAEYTAAFFFAFFMTILAVDMRAKALPPDFVLHG